MLRKIVTGLVAAAVVAGTTLAATSAADAQPNWYWQHHQHHYNQYYGGYGYNDNGAAIAAGVFGLIGGLMLSEIGHEHYYGYGGYCETHFRTYSSTSHQYMGYDGNLHYCYD